MPLLKLDQIVIKDLGKKQYQETFSAMKDFVAKGEDESIWMLEHDPVFTLGTAADQKHILKKTDIDICLLYTSPSPRDLAVSRMPSSA